MKSPNGMYLVKVHANGTTRAIAVDDKVFESNGKMGLTTTARNEFWPAIIEKAILKLYNCRDFKLESNPSCEIFHLSGWIPEIIKFSEIPNKAQLFNKINSNFEDGNVLLCLGVAENLFFPVIDFRVRETSNHIKVILPTSPFKAKDVRHYSEPINPTSTSAFGDETGVKWLDWNDVVLQTFDTLYLSWNPSIYNYRFTFNSVWYKGKKDTLYWNQEYSVEYNPQFLIHIPPHADNLEIRIYLERFTDDFSSKRGISYKLFTYTATRVFHPSESLRNCMQNKRELYSDVFIFEGSDRSEYYTLVILKNDADGTVWETMPEEVAFTLGVLSFYKIDVIEIPYNLAKQEQMVFHELEPTDFGGSVFNPNFLENPVFIIDVKKQMSYQFKVEFSDPSVVAMICLIGVEHDLNDIRQTNYEYFERRACPEKANEGVSELNCLLEAGRYLMIVALENTHPVKARLTGIITAYDKDKSDHPNTVLKQQDNCFTAIKMDRSVRKQRFPSQTVLSGTWREKPASPQEHSRYGRKTSVCWTTLAQIPGFVINFKEDGVFMFNLRSKGYENHFRMNMQNKERLRAPPSLKISIFKILDLGNVVEVLDDQIMSAAAWGYWTKELRLPCSEKGYLILCHTSVEAHQDPFELQILSTIRSSIEYKSTEDYLRAFHEQRTENGSWDDNNSGGPITEPTFERNPYFEVVVPPGPAEILITLTGSTFGSPISFLGLFPFPNGVSQLDLISQPHIDQAIFSKSSSSSIEVLLHLVLKNDSYTRWLCVPFLNRPGERGNFSLVFRSTAKEIGVSKGILPFLGCGSPFNVQTVPLKPLLQPTTYVIRE
jgi:Calpain family cysteine protease